MWRPIIALLKRDLKHTLRERGSLLSALVRPIIWLVIIGSGFGTIVPYVSQHSYQAFMVPGLFGMVLLFGGVTASLSMAQDKEQGVMRMLIVAPFSHYWIVLTRIVSSAMTSILQVMLFVIILLPFHFFTQQLSLILLTLGIVSVACASSALGVMIAVFSKSMERFSVIINFVVFPIFFLSGALYPIDRMGELMKVIMALNPFSYSVDLLQHAFGTSLTPRFMIVVDLIILNVFTLVSTYLAATKFSNTSVFEMWVTRSNRPYKGVSQQ